MDDQEESRQLQASQKHSNGQDAGVREGVSGRGRQRLWLAQKGPGARDSVSDRARSKAPVNREATWGRDLSLAETTKRREVKAESSLLRMDDDDGEGGGSALGLHDR